MRAHQADVDAHPRQRACESQWRYKEPEELAYPERWRRESYARAMKRL